MAGVRTSPSPFAYTRPVQTALPLQPTAARVANGPNSSTSIAAVVVPSPLTVIRSESGALGRTTAADATVCTRGAASATVVSATSAPCALNAAFAGPCAIDSWYTYQPARPSFTAAVEYVPFFAAANVPLQRGVPTHLRRLF